MVVPKHLAEPIGRKIAPAFAKSLPIQDHKAIVSAHITNSPDFIKNKFGKGFGKCHKTIL